MGWTELAKSLGGHHYKVIEQFYEEWKGPIVPDLKFRFVKMFTYNVITKSYQWNFLHRLVDRNRSVDIREEIREGMSRGVIPLRIFHSAAEWYAPYKFVGTSHKSWILRQGIIPLECDESLASSIIMMEELRSEIKRFVYTGNRSIHAWLTPDDDIWKRGKEDLHKPEEREKYDLFLRKLHFQRISDMVSVQLDPQTTIDSRRVIPMIGTLNALTGRIVNEIPDAKWDEELKATLY